jgi:hypothetical protein
MGNEETRTANPAVRATRLESARTIRFPEPPCSTEYMSGMFSVGCACTIEIVE